ncbi:MAG: PIN domain-containing protein [Pseudohongiellaceae bacterium]
MSEKRRFLDSNIILYLLSGNEYKALCSEQLLEQGGVISVQVLNEVTNVMRRKLAFEWREIDDFMGTCETLLEVRPLTLATHHLGRQLARRYHFSLYDSMIMASAIESGCDRLFTEDLQPGQVISKTLTILNPYA